jgi:hypothetical protein
MVREDITLGVPCIWRCFKGVAVVRGVACLRRRRKIWEATLTIYRRRGRYWGRHETLAPRFQTKSRQM